MKRREKKVYSKEFREEAVRHARTSGKSVAEVAKQLGITGPTLSAWISKAEPSSPREDLQAENQRLKRDLELLKKEHEILLKAAAFFAKRHV